MKYILFILIVPLSLFSASDTTEYVLTKSEWLRAFNEAHSILFCENMTAKKFCKSLRSSDCISRAEQSTLSCAKKIVLPTYIPPGFPSKETGLRLGSCVARSFEKYKRETASCQ